MPPTSAPPVREPKLELIADYPCETGEGPLWHADHECLYWLDIPPGRLYQYHPSSATHRLVYQADRPIGGFTIQVDGSLLLFMGAGRVMRWREEGTEILIPELPAERDTRFNDVIAGPQGQVFCGTMSARPSPPYSGRLYHLAPNGAIHSVLEGIGTSNGMGFTPDLTHFYHTDTRPGVVTRYPWRNGEGDFDRTEPRAIYTAPQEPDYGRPDGMTVDAAGDLWLAHWDGFSIVHARADGRILEFLALPERKISCVTFGGSDLTDMYVTTAGGNDRAFNGHHAGALYRIRGEAQGKPEFRSNIQMG